MKVCSTFVLIVAMIATATWPLSCAYGEPVVDWYRLTMTLNVPRVYNNTQSKGYRQYQRQRLSGYMKISYDTDDLSGSPSISVVGLENQTHKVNGKGITYECTVDTGRHVFPRVGYIGNNKTGSFRTATIVFRMDADPSYNIGEDDEDNSLFVTVSGHGSSGLLRPGSGGGGVERAPGRFAGMVSGTLGCGCSAYGHVSPTRVASWRGPSDVVDDVAPVYGTWTAHFVMRNGTGARY